MHTILGINGISGHGLATALKEKGLPVRGVGRSAGKGPWEHTKANVLDAAELLRALAGSETVYLVVGLDYNIKVWQRDWPIVMSNTIEACLAHGSKLVFMDNVYAYGYVRGVMREDQPLRPNSKKGKVRAEILTMLRTAMQKRGLRATVGRSADFYGPHCTNSILNNIVFDRHAKGQKAMWFGNPKKVHTFMFTDDIGPALAILGTDDRALGQEWHLPTSAERITGEEWVRRSAEAFGVKGGQQTVSAFMLRLIGLFNPLLGEFAEMNYQYTQDYVLSSEKFEKTFGLKPTDPATGLARTVASYKK